MIIQDNETLLNLPWKARVWWVQKDEDGIWRSGDKGHCIGDYEYHQRNANRLKEKFERGVIIFYTDPDEYETAKALLKF